MVGGRRNVFWENWGQNTARSRQLQEDGENILARHSTQISPWSSSVIMPYDSTPPRDNMPHTSN